MRLLGPPSDMIVDLTKGDLLTVATHQLTTMYHILEPDLGVLVLCWLVATAAVYEILHVVGGLTYNK
jgi:hypothetical protein